MGYTPEQRTEAVALALEHGMAEAHRRTGIPKPSISRWLTPDQHTEMAERFGTKTRAATRAHVEAAAEKRARLREDMLDQCARILARMSEPEVDFRGQHAKRVELDEAAPQSLRHLVWAFGTLLDKYRLEMGEATGRTEVHIPERSPDVEDELAKVFELVRDTG